MAKTKGEKSSASLLPLAPWVYLNQNHECTVGSKGDVAQALQSLIPKASVIERLGVVSIGGQGISSALRGWY